LGRKNKTDGREWNFKHFYHPWLKTHISGHEFASFYRC